MTECNSVKFNVTVHMDSREYKDGVATDTRGSDSYEDVTATEALAHARSWMTGTDRDNVTVVIEAIEPVPTRYLVECEVQRERWFSLYEGDSKALAQSNTADSMKQGCYVRVWVHTSRTGEDGEALTGREFLNG